MGNSSGWNPWVWDCGTRLSSHDSDSFAWRYPHAFVVGALLWMNCGCWLIVPPPGGAVRLGNELTTDHPHWSLWQHQGRSAASSGRRFDRAPGPFTESPGGASPTDALVPKDVVSTRLTAALPEHLSVLVISCCCGTLPRVRCFCYYLLFV